MSTSASLAGIPLKYISLVTLTVQNSMLTILLHYSRTSPSAKPYSAPAAVLLNEVLKCSISLSIALWNSFAVPLESRALSRSRSSTNGAAYGAPGRASSRQDEHGPTRSGLGWAAGAEPGWYTSGKGWKHEFGGRVALIFRAVLSHDCWKLSIPAILYVIQNNLQFVAASNLDVATFQVTYQLKILTTALCSVIMLKRRLSATKWWSLFGLAAGVALVQLQTATSSSSHSHGNPFAGFAAVTAACVTSGLAGVYFELVLKGSSVDLWIRNVQLSLFSLLPALAAAFVPDFPLLSNPTPVAVPVVRPPLFANFGIWAWATVLTQVLGGLITALVIKFADNILKGFATSLSIVLSFIAGVLLFNFQLTLGFTFGCSVVIASTYLYNTPDSPAGSERGSLWLRRGNGQPSPLPFTSKHAYFGEQPGTSSSTLQTVSGERYVPGSHPASRKPHDPRTPTTSTQTLYCSGQPNGLTNLQQEGSAGLVVDSSPRHRVAGRFSPSLSDSLSLPSQPRPGFGGMETPDMAVKS